MAAIAHRIHRLRLTPLALGFAALLAMPAPSATAGGGDPLVVTSCADDGGPGTLRSVMASAPGSATIDLTALTCSTITLEAGAIDNQFQAVTLLGPGADRLTIDGNDQDRVFNVGSITIDGLTVTHGHVSGDDARGGCIAASLGVVLHSARVVSCSVHGTQSASGGGIFAGYYVRLESSTVSDNTLSAASGYANGGGISAPYDGVTADFSTISGNLATGTPARGGGVFAMGFSSATHSTIDGNVADTGGGWFCQHAWFGYGNCEIIDSTVSGNTAHVSGGGVLAYRASLDIRNSTIAFNTAETGHVGGVLITGATYAITLQSSILANNTASGTDLAADIDTDGGNFPTVIGGDDLMTSIGRIQPFPIISDDPMLAPLAANGGPTLTHALLPGSPAIDAGNDFANLDTDQRGRARVSGAAADIGAYELQTDAMFADGFDPD